MKESLYNTQAGKVLVKPKKKKEEKRMTKGLESRIRL